MKTNTNKFPEDLARLPAMTREQAVRYFADAATLGRLLRSLKTKGLITIRTELVRERDTVAPIAIIRPGEPLPAAGAVAYAAERLWKRELQPRMIIQGTAKLVMLYGGEARTVVTGHISHDIALVEALLRKRQADPQFEWNLVSTKPGCVLPDAISASGAVMIELVGRYNANTLSAKFHLGTTATLELW